MRCPAWPDSSDYALAQTTNIAPRGSFVQIEGGHSFTMCQAALGGGAADDAGNESGPVILCFQQFRPQ